MYKIEYGIPMFEDKDKADLNEYSKQMAEALKIQLDKFGNPLAYKGQVDSIDDLPTNSIAGEIYSVISENKNYVWNGIEWIEFASTIDLTELEKKTIVQKASVLGQTLQEGTPSSTSAVPIKNVNVYGINILNNKAVPKTINGVTFTVNKDKSITAVGTATAQTAFYINSSDNTAKYEDIEAGEYTFNGCYYGSVDTYFMQVILEKANPSNNSQYFSNYDVPNTFKIEENNRYYAAIIIRQGVTVNATFWPKLEKESKSSNYTKYGTGLLELTLQKEEDTKKVFFVANRNLCEKDIINEWGYYYRKKQLILDGTENLIAKNSYYYFVSDELKKIGEVNNTICSHFKHNNNVGNCIVGDFVIDSSLASLSFYYDNGAGGVDNFKAYLAEQYANGTPVTIEYDLKEEEHVAFTNFNQNSWNELDNLLLQGYTFINSSSDELQPTVTLTEHTANEIHRENIDRLKNMEIRKTTGEEFVTDEYIDGKRVYGKIIDFGALPNATYKSVPIGETNIEYVRAYGKAKHTNGTTFTIPHAGTSVESNISLSLTSNYYITLETGIDRSAMNGIIEVYYTKN